MGWLVGGGRGKLQQVAKPPNLWISIFAFQKPVDLNICVSKTLEPKKKYSDIETWCHLTLIFAICPERDDNEIIFLLFAGANSRGYMEVRLVIHLTKLFRPNNEACYHKNCHNVSLYGLKQHILEISGDVTDAGRTNNEQGKIELLGFWTKKDAMHKQNAYWQAYPGPQVILFVILILILILWVVNCLGLTHTELCGWHLKLPANRSVYILTLILTATNTMLSWGCQCMHCNVILTKSVQNVPNISWFWLCNSFNTLSLQLSRLFT